MVMCCSFFEYQHFLGCSGDALLTHSVTVRYILDQSVTNWRQRVESPSNSKALTGCRR